ncbi:MAG: PAS domain-containing sensor histidine kinase, partial [Muribaculaceae bacterium]|nr:PAS domain-containing sensor histidine kinase [Muribaculaceae bacterium]
FFTTKSGGSGIGLSLSRQIVSMHGGPISFATASSGTTFTIPLPFIYRL